MADLDRDFAEVTGGDPPAGLEARILAAARARRRGWRLAAAATIVVLLCAGLDLVAAHRIESHRRADYEARTGLPWASREPQPESLQPVDPEDMAAVMLRLARRT